MPLTDSPPRPKTRSPLKDRPLRHAGQSVQETMDDMVVNALSLTVLIMAIIVFAIMEWWRSNHHDSFHPYAFSFLALFATVYFGWKIWNTFKELKLYKQGRDGERIVSEFLDQLCKDGYDILHDVVGGDFNVDHVLIGPTGVYAIETKTRSKSGGAEEKVLFDGANVFIHGYAVDPNPVNQAKANARWIRELLKQSTTKDFPVTPVVLFPGWYVERKSKSNDVLVLNPKNLESVLKSRSAVLPTTDVSLAVFHLKAFVRSKK